MLQKGYLMLQPGDIISYLDMCKEENVNLQRGMNFRLGGKLSVILMSVRLGAPYADRVEENGRILIYEGHDVPMTKGGNDPKATDQPDRNPGGSLTQNGRFHAAAMDYKRHGKTPELVKVYEKIKPGIWVYNGLFRLVDAWQEDADGRSVFKFKLELIEAEVDTEQVKPEELAHDRLIPSAVKLEVWKRDRGRCVQCGSETNLHFDHIIPYSKGGSSLVAANIQLLCAKHNLAKSDKIE